jgi:uracil-DNA glycosylase family 4
MDTQKLSYLHAMGIQPWQLKIAVPEIAPASDNAPWDLLRAAVSTCTACGLEKTRTQTVFGVGNRQAELIVIGEAPGFNEDKQGEPFVGRAGQLLNAMLEAIGFARDSVYIANILKCRPPQNRDPQAEEVKLCTPFLEKQIALIQPKLLLAVGRIAAQYLLNTKTALGQLRGRLHTFNNIPLIVTYHPAYLLRSPKDKSKAWQDLQMTFQTLQSL